MAGRTVTIQVAGKPEDQGRPRLSEFIEQLEAVKNALRQTARIVSSREEPVLYYRVKDLSRASPFTVVIEAVPLRTPDAEKRRVPDFSEETVERFFTYTRQVKNKQIPPEMDLAALEAFKGLSALLDKHMAEIAVVNSQERIEIDREFRAVIDKYIGPDEIIEGSVAGVLEKVNFHNTYKFYIYPTVGPKQVECDFPTELRRDVKEGLDNYVRVHGSLRYKWLSPYPYAVTARKIEVYPPENELPTIFDLRGIAPDVTGGLSIEDFVDKIRAEAAWEA